MARLFLPQQGQLSTDHIREQKKMSDLTACASCDATQKLRQCSRCKPVAYCSSACQRAHWRIHKPLCHFKVVLPSVGQAVPPNDTLSILHTISEPGTKQQLKKASPAMQQTFNIPEPRLFNFSLLPARDLLRSQRVCRSWYLTTTSERKFQQRMFFAAGPGELIMPAREGCTSIAKTL
jgi:hypothetical protein